MTAAPTYIPADQLPTDTQTRGVGGDPFSEQAIVDAPPTVASPARPHVPADQRFLGAQVAYVGGDTYSEQARHRTTPTEYSPARPLVPADQVHRDPHGDAVGGDPICGSDQPSTDAHGRHVAAAPTSLAPTTTSPAPTGPASERGTPDPEQAMRDTSPRVGSPARAPLPSAPAIVEVPPRVPAPVPGESDRPRGSAKREPAPRQPALSLADPLLALAADVLDDLERVRVANENRLRQLTRTEEDSDGLERGFGLPEDHPDVARLAALVDGLAAAEHQAELNLKRQLRQHPLGPWARATRGVGEKQAARLLASVGDPYWNTLHDRPRTVSELRSYCGWGDARAQVRRRGQKNRWSDTAKKRTWVVVASCVKQLRKPCAKPDGQSWAEHVDDCDCSPYRLTYDESRRRYADTVHDIECVRCGPSGQPAQPGSPRAAGHQEAMAYRVAAKEVLKHLWREAKRLHELPVDHRASGAHATCVGGDPSHDQHDQ